MPLSAHARTRTSAPAPTTAALHFFRDVVPRSIRKLTATIGTTPAMTSMPSQKIGPRSISDVYRRAAIMNANPVERAIKSAIENWRA